MSGVSWSHHSRPRYRCTPPVSAWTPAPLRRAAAWPAPPPGPAAWCEPRAGPGCTHLLRSCSDCLPAAAPLPGPGTSRSAPPPRRPAAPRPAQPSQARTRTAAAVSLARQGAGPAPAQVALPASSGNQSGGVADRAARAAGSDRIPARALLEWVVALDSVLRQSGQQDRADRVDPAQAAGGAATPGSGSCVGSPRFQRQEKG